MEIAYIIRDQGDKEQVGNDLVGKIPMGENTEVEKT